MCNKADELRERFPFQAELIRLMAVTGLRREEACKIWKEDIKWKYEVFYDQEGNKFELFGKIILRSGITKSGT